MTAHGNARTQYHLDAVVHLAAALQFHAIGTRLLHDAHGIALRLDGVALVGAKGHIHQHHGAFHGAHHRAAIHNHIVDGDGHRRGVTLHHIRGAVAHQNHVDACLIYKARHREVVGRYHGYLLARQFHFLYALGGHFLGVGDGVS